MWSGPEGTFAGLVASGRLVDAILVLVALEALLLALWHRRTGRGVPFVDLAPNLAAGAFLLLTARAALVDAHWPWIAASLLLALLAHLLDLARRWRHPPA